MTTLFYDAVKKYAAHRSFPIPYPGPPREGLLP